MSENKKKLSRHEQRSAAFCLIFEHLFRADESPADIYLSEREDNEYDAYEYIRNTFVGAEQNASEIDSLINGYAVGWSLERLSFTARAVLRLAVYELLYSDVPPKVVINEAVELSKEFASPEEASFVNGILNRLSRDKGLIAADGGEK
jgi:N utilization substance protein B